MQNGPDDQGAVSRGVTVTHFFCFLPSPLRRHPSPPSSRGIPNRFPFPPRMFLSSMLLIAGIVKRQAHCQAGSSSILNAFYRHQAPSRTSRILKAVHANVPQHPQVQVRCLQVYSMHARPLLASSMLSRALAAPTTLRRVCGQCLLLLLRT